MAGSIEYLEPGQPAEAALAAAVDRLKAGDPLAPVTVVVRSALAGRDLRRRLAARSSLAGVGFMPLARLAELLAAGDEGGRSPVSRPVLGAAVRASLYAAPGIFATVADHPATEESLVSSYKEIRQLEEPERRRLASMSDRARDVVRLTEEVSARLSSSFYDSEDLLETAAAAISQGRADLSDIGPVVVHGPDPLGRRQRELLAAVAGQTALVVQLTMTGDKEADGGLSRLAGQLASLGFAEGASSRPTARPAFDRVVGAPDADEEVRNCLRLLMGRLEKGGGLGDVAIALPSGEASGYLALVEELFGAAGLPWTSPGTGEIGSVGLGAVALRLLGLLSVPGRPFERQEVIGLISSPFVVEGGGLLAGLSPASLEQGRPKAGAFDRISCLAGVVAGEAEWSRRLGYLAKRLEDQGREARAAQAGDLRRIVSRLSGYGARLGRATSWREVAEAAIEAVSALGPASEDQERILDALGEIPHLDGLEPLAPPEQSERRALQLTACFAQALSLPAPSRGRFGGGPVVGTLGALGGMRPGLLFVLGAGEGALPGRTPEDPLVNELEREAVPTLKEAERAEQRDRRFLLWLLAAADEAVASYPRVGRGSARPAYPSRWLNGDLYLGEHEQLASHSAAVASVAAGERAAADAADLELALALGAAAGRGGLLASPLGRLGDFGRRIEAENERARKGLSRFAGRLGPERVDQEVFAAVMSATKMESLARCPLQFMFERLVRVEELEAPDRLPVMEPRVRGTLIHEVLEEFVAATMEPGGKAHWRDPSFSLLRRLAAEHFERAESRGLTGKDVYWQMVRRRILSDLERFVSLEAERLAANGAVPLRTEMAFGDGDVPPVAISIGEGRQVRFRGKVDRVDKEPGGRLRVIDYKSGRDSGYAGMKADPLGGGRHLQLPIYAKAASELIPEAAGEVVAEYRFCSSDAGFRTLPVALTPELDERLAEVLAVLCDTVDAGSFPPRPGNGNEAQPTNCRGCAYDPICRLDKAARWEEAAGEEEMAAYVELVKAQR